MLKRLGLPLLMVLVSAAVLHAQAQPIICNGSLSQVRVVRLLNEGVGEKRIIQFITTCGVDFDLTESVVELLQAVNVTKPILSAIRAVRSEGASGSSSTAAAPQTLGADPNGLTWVRIPAGTFEMGCVPGDGECSDDEKPRHTVTLRQDYWLMTTAVTVGQYRSVRGSLPDQPLWNVDNRLPVVNVTWDEAVGFCQTVGGRLPTEAEWERAARGGKNGLRYPSSYVLTREDANFKGTGGRDRWENASPVGSFPANGYGLFDMAGNVWQWAADRYDAIFYSNTLASDPSGSASGTDRVVRGGSWYGTSTSLRVSGRSMNDPAHRVDLVGFRCARDVAPR